MSTSDTWRALKTPTERNCRNCFYFRSRPSNQGYLITACHQEQDKKGDRCADKISGPYKHWKWNGA